MQLSSGKQIWATAWQKQQNDVRPAKTQISLDIRPVWSESSLYGETLDPQLPSECTANLSLCSLAHRSFYWFCHAVVHIYFSILSLM